MCHPPFPCAVTRWLQSCGKRIARTPRFKQSGMNQRHSYVHSRLNIFSRALFSPWTKRNTALLKAETFFIALFTFQNSRRVISVIFMYDLGQENASGSSAESRENVPNSAAALFI